MIKYIMFAVSLIFTTEAYAISNNVRFSCVSDYLKYCFPSPIDSEEVKECFRRIGKDLQPDCIAALKEDGLITEEDKAKAVEETPKEEPPIVLETPKTEPVIIGEKPKTEPTVVKSNVLQDIAKRVAAKLKETTTVVKTKIKETSSVNPVVVNGRKVQRGGKWDGYPLYLDWNTNRRNLGGELTPYGLEDRN